MAQTAGLGEFGCLPDLGQGFIRSEAQQPDAQTAAFQKSCRDRCSTLFGCRLQRRERQLPKRQISRAVEIGQGDSEETQAAL